MEVSSLKNKRKEKKLTQEEVAKEAGICRGYYSNIENGKKRCSVDTWFRIAECLEISESELVPYMKRNKKGA